MQASKGTGALQIGELAARSGLTPDTLRYYERLGLLSEARRTSGGFRMYPSQTLERLRFIKHAQSLGLTLHEIRDLVTYQEGRGLQQCRQVRDLLRTKLTELQAKLAELEEFRNMLARYLAECEHTLDGEARSQERGEPDCPVIETLRTKPR